MPIVSKIARLPIGIRRALALRLADEGFGNVVDATAWLQAQGHQVGKSAVGRFAQELKAREEKLQASQPVVIPPLALAQLKLGSAAIAAAEGAGERLFQRAEEVLAWALDPASPQPRSADVAIGTQ